MVSNFNQHIVQSTPWATHGQVPSARSQKNVMLAANGGHMGLKRGSQIVVFGIRFCEFLFIFSDSILEVIYDSFSRIVMILESLLVTMLHAFV